MTLRTLAGAGVVLVLLFGHARADNKQDAKPHVAAADKAYQLGRFADALGEYSKAYELFAAPPLLFNIAQCHRNLKNWDRAIFFFEGYLAARPAAQNRKFVEELLQEAQGELDKQREAIRRRAEADEKVRLQAEQLRLTDEQKLRIEAERQRLDDSRRFAVARHEEDDRGRRDRERQQNGLTHQWWFWTAVGGVALAAGGTAYYLSGSTTMVPPTGSLGGLDRR